MLLTRRIIYSPPYNICWKYPTYREDEEGAKGQVELILFCNQRERGDQGALS